MKPIHGDVLEREEAQTKTFLFWAWYQLGFPEALPQRLLTSCY